ncbi:histone-binding protein MSI1-like [Phalaenopsis equestris]|uniref:histone-binding protein MSI1-like n=1 Tax=Phalaenopsis equestris TaxID=78828 RepID=UPI0009E22E75|nr:histone-binding protein MSI1-like [Phalaenopsis equestris]
MLLPEDGEASAAEEFRVWKKNSPYLYDLVISHALEWPSLTVQWLPSSSSSHSSSFSTIQRLVLGTHTSDDTPNFLLISAVQFPSPSHLSSEPPLNLPLAPLPNVRIEQRISHEGEVNRARYMPQKPSLIATKTCGPEVHVFDSGKRPMIPPEGDTCRPDFVLRGHQTEGYGLAWSSRREGYLLSGSYDYKICLWDVGIASNEKNLDCNAVFEAHEAAVEDVEWHSENDNMFGSVGDDHRLMLWDLRSSRKPEHSLLVHEDEVNSLSFNPFNEWLLATASADTNIKLFDLRKLSLGLHTFYNHTGPVLQVEWSPHRETLLASSSEDKKLMLWDLCRIGDEQTEGDASDGPPELLFVHGGHTAKISEFSWNPEEPWVIASVAEDNILQVWQVAESIYRNFYDNESDGEA